MKALTRSAIVLTFWFIAVGLVGQSSGFQVPDDVKTGVLANGIPYFVQKNTAIKNRVQLRLVVHAGSVVEMDDEQGFAHLVEHLQFQGTKNFPPQAIVDFLEGAGMKFGPEVNAQTSHTRVQYFFDLPSNRPEVLATGYRILEDWAQGPQIDPGRLEIEKKVVLEERRQRMESLSGRAGEFFNQLQYSETPYESRNPIGDAKIVAGATIEALNRFVQRWYTPANQALIVVGDIDPNQVEQDLKTRFQERFGAMGQVNRTDPPVPPYREPRIVSFRDRDLSNNELAWFTVIPSVQETTRGRREFQLLNSWMNLMINQRLGELSRQSGTTLVQASSWGSQLKRDAFLRGYTLVPMNGKLTEALGDFTAELERIRQLGFTASEFALAQQELVSQVEKAYASREATPNERRADAIATGFLWRVDVLSDEQGYRLDLDILRKANLAQVNEFTQKALENPNYRLAVLTVDRADNVPPSDAQLLTTVVEARKRTFSQNAERVQGVLVPQPPVPGTIVSKTAIPGIQATRYVLSNGATVIAKQTQNKKDEIVLTAWAPGGTSVVSDAEFLDLQIALSVFEANGVGPFNYNQYLDFLKGKQLSLRLGIQEVGVTLSGQSTPGDLETWFQVFWHRLSGVRRDPSMEKTTMGKIQQSVANTQDLPATWFQNEKNRVLLGGHPRSLPLTPARVASVDLDRAERLYQKVFPNLSGLTLVAVGDFEMAKIEKYLASWVAPLPAGTPQPIQDLGIRPLQGPVTSVVTKGQDQKAQVYLATMVPHPFIVEEFPVSQVVQTILDLRLRDVLRNEKGGTYGASVRLNHSKVPWGRVGWSVSFQCELARQEELVRATLQTIDSVRQGNFDDSALTKAKEILIQGLEKNAQQNGFWVANILSSVQNGIDPARIAEWKTAFEAVDRSAIGTLARDALATDAVYHISLLPER